MKPDSSPQYEIGFLFQELTICTSAMMYYGVDSVAISMVIFGCAQMEIIMEKILSVSWLHDRFHLVDNASANDLKIQGMDSRRNDNCFSLKSTEGTANMRLLPFSYRVTGRHQWLLNNSLRVSSFQGRSQETVARKRQ